MWKSFAYDIPTTWTCTSVTQELCPWHGTNATIYPWVLEYLKRLEKAAVKLQWNGKVMKSANGDLSLNDTKRMRRRISSQICSFRLSIIKINKAWSSVILSHTVLHYITLHYYHALYIDVHSPIIQAMQQWGSYHIGHDNLGPGTNWALVVAFLNRIFGI